MIIVAMASPLSAGNQRSNAYGNASSQTRMNAANAAAFTVAAMYAVIGDGAPSYTSGAHMWNGTVATLNPKPINMSAMPATSSGLDASWKTAIRPAMIVRFVVPVAPYTSAMPYSRNAVENAPSRKYLSAPSADRTLRRLIPARA